MPFKSALPWSTPSRSIPHVSTLYCCRLKKLLLGRNKIVALSMMACVTNLMQVGVVLPLWAPSCALGPMALAVSPHMLLALLPLCPCRVTSCHFLPSSHPPSSSPFMMQLSIALVVSPHTLLALPPL